MRERDPASPPLAIANPGDIASIHSGDEAVALPCRLTSTASLASAATPRRASTARSEAASISPLSNREAFAAVIRNRQ